MSGTGANPDPTWSLSEPSQFSSLEPVYLTVYDFSMNVSL